MRLRRVCALLLLVALVGGCDTGSDPYGPNGRDGRDGRDERSAPAPTATGGSPGPGPPVAEPSEPFAGVPAPDVAADLDQLRDSVQRIHPEGLRDGAALPTTAADVAGTAGTELLATTMAALAGRPRDGHSGVFPTAQDTLPMWPLQLYDFDDGWRVVATDAEHAHLVGRAVTGVGGVAVEEAAALVAPLVPRDNAASLRGRLPLYLVVPAVLAGVGLGATLQLDGEVVTPATVPAADYADRFGLFSPLVCPPLPRPGGPAWTIEDDRDAVVLRYRRVVFSSDGTSSEDLAAQLADRLGTTDASRLVLDLRDNPGGELPAAAPIVEVAQRFAADHPAGLRILVGRCTFSAAALTVAELVATTDAVLVGEAVGGSPGIWADPRTVTLPETQLVAHVGRTWYPPADPGLPVQLEPDVAVPVRWTDHRDGTDPAFDAARAG